MNRDERDYVSTMMIGYGGNFVKALGRALREADATNAQKIKDAWPEYWQKYLDMATGGGK